MGKLSLYFYLKLKVIRRVRNGIFTVGVKVKFFLEERFVKLDLRMFLLSLSNELMKMIKYIRSYLKVDLDI